LHFQFEIGSQPFRQFKYAEKLLAFRIETGTYQCRNNKSDQRMIISFFSENKIPFDKRKIGSLIAIYKKYQIRKKQ